MNDLLNKEQEEIENVFFHCVDRITSPLFPVKMVKNNSRISKKKNFITDLVSFINNESSSTHKNLNSVSKTSTKQLTIDDLIEIMEDSLKSLSTINKSTCSKIIAELITDPKYLCIDLDQMNLNINVNNSINPSSPFNLDLDNILLDLQYNSNIRNDYFCTKLPVTRRFCP